MAKIIMNDGMVIEGTAEELAQLAKTFGEGAESSDRVIEGDPKVGDLTTGSIVKITEEAGYDGHYRAELLDGSDYDHAPASSLEKLTEKEVKFAEIGRKVDEFKVGDIVEVTMDNANASRNMAGDIGYVGDVTRGGRFYC